MRVRELSLRNYRVFEEVDLELPARVIGVFGPNGSGKTTICEAIQYGCYGKARTDKSQIRTHGVLTDCQVRVVFEHGGQQYEVRRSIRGRNHQTDAELYAGDVQLASGVTEVDAAIQGLLRMDVQVFRASVFAEQKQLDAFSDVTKGKRKDMVLRLLGIRPVDEARTVSRKEARERKKDADRLAGTLPDLAEQEKALQEARTAAEQVQDAAEKAAEDLRNAQERDGAAEKAFGEADRIRQEAERLATARQVVAEEVERLQAHHTEVSDRIARLRADLAALPDLERERERLADAAERLVLGRRLVEVDGDLRQLRARLAKLPEIDAEAALAELETAQEEARAADRTHTKAESAHERTTRDLAEAEDALAKAAEADPSQACPTCGRPLGDDFREYVKHCRDRVRLAKAEARTAATALKAATTASTATGRRLNRATTAGEAAREAAGARADLGTRIEESEAKLAELAEPFRGQVPDLQELEADAHRAQEIGARVAELTGERKHLSALERDLGKAGSDLEVRRSKLEALDKETAALAFDPEDHARLRKERDEAERLLHQAQGKEREAAAAAAEARQSVTRLEGALDQAHQTRGKVEELRDEARYLDRVSGLLEGFRTYLYGRIVPELSREAEALFRDLTSSEYDDLRIDADTLAIEIADGDRYFPIERFSGSESDLANLALRVAISTHLSRMWGADVGMLVLDEVLASLDVERKDLFVRTMGRLAGRFHQVFVITHAEQVKDQFPATLEVRRVGRRRSEVVLT
jgi:exonuclease SbcC